MWERRGDPDLQLRIKVWQTVHFLYGCAFQVDVKEYLSYLRRTLEKAEDFRAAELSIGPEAW